MLRLISERNITQINKHVCKKIIKDLFLFDVYSNGWMMYRKKKLTTTTTYTHTERLHTININDI
jgi:phenylalanyl-tRNA synthetase beta subunit